MLIYNPRQTVLISCRGNAHVMGSDREVDEIFSCHWHMPLSSHPPMYAIAIKKDFLAADIIRDSKSFVVNFMPFSHVENVKKAMMIAPGFSAKCEDIGLTSEDCEKIVDCFRVKEALGWIECEVVDEKEAGDHIVFFGRADVVFMKGNEKRPFHVDKDDFTTTQ